MPGCAGRFAFLRDRWIPASFWPSLPGRATVCAAALSCAPGSARIVPPLREAPPHRGRGLLRRRTTEPCSLFVSNLHNAPTCRKPSGSALFECGKPLIGWMFTSAKPTPGALGQPFGSPRANGYRLAEIDSVVLHRPHWMLRCAYSPYETGAPADKGLTVCDSPPGASTFPIRGSFPTPLIAKLS